MLKSLLRIKTDARDKPTWKQLLKKDAPVLLPAAHDALTARLIEKMGFSAYQVGGFALVASRHAFPDIDLCHYGEQRAGLGDIMEAATLPVMIDADDGYGDVKNMTRTIQGYEALGASAIFFEDQKAPKRCGHMDGKEVIAVEDMVSRVKAAVAARADPDTFLIARTDAIAPLGLDEALRRAEAYLKAGADGIFIEGPKSVEDLETIGREFRHVPKIANMLEGGGQTPILPPAQLHAMSFQMITYPTTVLFRATRMIQRALQDLLDGKPLPPDDSVDFKTFEDIVDKDLWAGIEQRFGKG
jgi:2-methylisocitrate lyase-like PEP mutase family enzyme